MTADPRSRDDVLAENDTALRNLAALPHPDAIPDDWRTGDQPLTLTDVVAVICRHVAPNTLGAPPPNR